MEKTFITNKPISFTGKKFGYEAVYVLEDNDKCFSYIKQHNGSCMIVYEDGYATHKEPISPKDVSHYGYIGNAVERYFHKCIDSMGNKTIYYKYLGDYAGLFKITICFNDQQQADNYVADDNWIDISDNKELKLRSIYKKSLSQILQELEDIKNSNPPQLS